MLYPLQHRGDGAFFYAGDVLEEIAASILVILTTVPGEHPRLPDFGNHAALFVFRNPGVRLERLIKGTIKDDIERWEPRAKVEEVKATYNYDDASYTVSIYWSAPAQGLISPTETQIVISGGM